jgi:hypothetical protein
VNNGVSVVHLRRFASQLECSPQLILRLWHSNIREGMILATLLFDEDNFFQDNFISCQDFLKDATTPQKPH